MRFYIREVNARCYAINTTDGVAMPKFRTADAARRYALAHGYTVEVSDWYALF